MMTKRENYESAGWYPWLTSVLSYKIEIKPIAGDASFRQYYRIKHDNQTYILMDAPPAEENATVFVLVAKALLAAGCHVPKIIAEQSERGWVLMSDLGDDLYLDSLSDLTASEMYHQALDALIPLHQSKPPQAWPYPHFNHRFIQREFGHFTQWCLYKLLGYQTTTSDSKILDELCTTLITAAVSQPQVTVHRDYHSRNLLCVAENNPGIIDFQDAVIGPITYDAVSLLKDCYIAWPESQVTTLSQYFYDQVIKAKLMAPVDFQQWQYWFDMVGLQRHLKVLGIFSRLYLRDGKSRYLLDMPRILQYILQVTQKYSNLAPFHHTLETTLWPLLEAFWSKQGIKGLKAA